MLRIRLQGTKNAIRMGVKMILRSRKFAFLRISDLEKEKTEGIYRVRIDLSINHHLEAEKHNENVKMCDRFFATKTKQFSKQWLADNDDRKRNRPRNRDGAFDGSGEKRRVSGD